MYNTLMRVHSRACASKVLPHTEIVTGHVLHLVTMYVTLIFVHILHYITMFITLMCAHILHYITIYITLQCTLINVCSQQKVLPHTELVTSHFKL